MFKNIRWGRLIFFVGVSLAAGGLAALLTGGNMDVYEKLTPKPPLAPPGIVFPIVWSILYVLMGVAAYLVSVSRPPKTAALTLFFLQLAVNALWPLLFFNLLAFKAAFFLLLLLLGLVIACYFAFRQHSRTAGNLLIPYILWLVFAAWLNFWFAFIA